MDKNEIWWEAYHSLKQNKALYAYFEARGISKLDLSAYDVGLGINKDFDFEQKIVNFNKAVVFPIKDLFGRPIAFSYKKAGKHDFVTNGEKTQGYLWNFYESLFRYDFEWLVLCEGCSDALTFEYLGWRAISLNTATYSVRQLRDLYRYHDKYIICFDNDSTGEKFAGKLSKALFEKGCIVRSLSIKPYKDANEALQELGYHDLSDLVFRRLEFEDVVTEREIESGVSEENIL